MRAPGWFASIAAAGRGLLQFGSVGATAHGMPNPDGRYAAAFNVTSVVAGLGQAGGAPLAGFRTSFPPLVRNGGSVVVNGMFVTSATPNTIPFGCLAASFASAVV